MCLSIRCVGAPVLNRRVNGPEVLETGVSCEFLHLWGNPFAREARVETCTAEPRSFCSYRHYTVKNKSNTA